jgi:hypothetical protein
MDVVDVNATYFILDGLELSEKKCRKPRIGLRHGV